MLVQNALSVNGTSDGVRECKRTNRKRRVEQRPSPEETRDTLYAGGIYFQPVGAYPGLDFLRIAPPSTLTLLNSQTPNDLNLFCSLQLSFTPSFGGAFFFGSITPFPTKHFSRIDRIVILCL